MEITKDVLRSAYRGLSEDDQITLDLQVKNLRDRLGRKRGNTMYFGRGMALELLAQLGIWMNEHSGACPNCQRDYFENETIVDGELRCSCGGKSRTQPKH